MVWPQLVPLPGVHDKVLQTVSEYCREEKTEKEHGAAITRATMANWVIL